MMRGPSSVGAGATPAPASDPGTVSFSTRKGRVAMVTVLDPRHLQLGAHRRFWLIVAAIIAFLLAALWTQPVG